MKTLILFFKAVKTKSVHQSSLFDQVDQVSGYVNTATGKFVGPYQAKHKHALKPAPEAKVAATKPEAPNTTAKPNPVSAINTGIIKITAYCKKRSAATGGIGAGTFYFLNTDTIPASELHEYQLEFDHGKVLKVSQKDVDNFGLPSEALAVKWFPGRRWSEHDQDGGIEIDQAVAAEAIKRGYQAIQYGETELQILDPIKTPNPPQEKNSDTNSVVLYRAGPINDPRKTGVFLSTKEESAKKYLRSDNPEIKLNSYKIKSGLKLKEAATRYSLIKEIDPSYNFDKNYSRFISAEQRNGGKPINGMNASGLLQTDMEKKIRIALEKQGYHGVRYSGDRENDQAGEYQIFNPNNIVKQ